MSVVRVIALGNESAGDDGAAIAAARRLSPEEGVEIVVAGRLGVGLLDLLDPGMPTVLADVVRSGASAGRIHEIRLEDVVRRSLAREQVSSHGFGPAETLRLAQALGHALPRGIFVGIEGARFDPGTALGPEVASAIDDLVDVLRGAIDAMRAAPANQAGEIDMHEHGILDRLVARALDEARSRGGALRGLRVRLGALAASTPERLQEDFAHVLSHLGDPAIALEIEEAPQHPAGVELVAIDVAARGAAE